jgi:hypothetical protein
MKFDFSFIFQFTDGVASWFTLFVLPHADDAFLKHVKNDYKPIFYHLNYNWYFILAYGQWNVEIEKWMVLHIHL